MSKPSLTEQDRARKALINAEHFDPANIGVGGGVWKYVGNSSHNSPAFKEGHERIFGKQDMFKNLAKKE